MSQQDYEDLPTVPYIDKHGRAIPNDPELPANMRAQLTVLYLLQKQTKQEPIGIQTNDHIPWYPQVQWESTPTTLEDERPNCILSVTTKGPPARTDMAERDPALRRVGYLHQTSNKLTPSD